MIHQHSLGNIILAFLSWKYFVYMIKYYMTLKGMVGDLIEN